MTKTFTVAYRREPTFRTDPSLTAADLVTEKFSVLGTVIADNVDEIFSRFQHHNWTDLMGLTFTQAARDAQHMSMSVGDIVIDNQTHEAFECLPTGWRLIGIHTENS